MADIHYLGEFPTFNAVWKMFPNGGGYGDYVTILGVHYDWDESTNSWGDDPGDVNPALPEVVNHDIDVQGTVTARDGIKTADYIQGEAGAFIDGAGDAEFRSVNVDALWVKDPVTGEHMSLPDFIKKYKTELPPDWAEYEQIIQFDNVRILAFDPLSQDKFYTTIGALKKLISDSIGAGSTGGGTFDIEILRSDDPEGIPTDNNVFSSLKTILTIQAALGPIIGQYLSRINPDEANGLIKFLAGAEFGEFLSGILGGKGARIDELGNIEATSLALRGFLSAPEYRFNRITFVGDETIFSDMGTIEEVELLEGRLYRLTMRLEEDDNITFKVGDLVKGIYHYNTYGFSTSYMRVESVIDEYMDVLLVDNEDTPTLSNYPPTQFMKIARVGYAGVDFPERSRYVVASSKAGGIQVWDGCVDFLSGRIVASMDLSQAFKSQYGPLPTIDGLPYLYAAGIVTEHIIRIDYEGVPVREVYDRGTWEAGRIYYNNDDNGTDDVWHLGFRWRCFASSTTEEPSWTSADWVNIEGRPNMMVIIEQYYISTSSSELVGGEWTEEIPIWEEDKYIYSRSKILYQDGSETFTDPVYVPILNGKSVTKIDVEYATSSSRQIAPTEGWQTTDPGVQQGEYLWSRTTVYYSDGTHEIFGEVCISGNDGDPGDPGENAVIYSLLPSVSVIKRNSAGQDDVANISCKVFKTDGASTSEISSLPIGYELHYKIDSNSSVKRDPGYSQATSGITTKIEFILYKVGEFYNRLDNETVYVVKDGIDRENSYTVLLSNEAHVFAGTEDYAIPTTLEVYIHAFKGSTPVSLIVDDITIGALPLGLTAQKYADRVVFTVSSTPPLMVSPSGEVPITVTIDGQDYVRNFSYAISFKGADGTAKDIRLEASTQIMRKLKDGTWNPSTPVTVTATAINTTISTWEYSVNGGTFSTTPPIGITRSGDVVSINPNAIVAYALYTIRASDGTISDTLSVIRLEDGGDGEDGYSVSLSKSEHTFNYDKNGNLKGILSDGTISVEVLNGSNPLICDSLGVSAPTTDGTYRVTDITISPSTTLSYNVDRLNSVFRLIPTMIVAEEVMVTFTIIARTKGVNATFTRQLKYQKSHDGADGGPGGKGDDGDSVVHIYKQYPTKPATPSSGVVNPAGWSRNPDYILSIVSQTNWTVNGKWHQSEELTASGNSSTSRITFTTYKDAQTITLELWADGHATYDYVYAGILDTAVSTSNYYNRVRGGRIIITYDVPTAGNHYIDIFWRKGIATIVGSNRGYYAIISDVKVWRSATNVIGGVAQDWSEPQQFDIDTSAEERIYCLSKTTTAPAISDSDAYINDYIPLPCSLSSYRGDFTTNRAYPIGQVVRYQFEYYKVVQTITSASTRYPTDEEYFEKIPGWTDNPVGANKDYPFEFVAIRKKQSDGLWGPYVTSVWSNYGVGTNYIPMGWWEPSITYSKTELGIPLVKKADGTALGYSVYTLKVSASTLGTFIPSEWDLMESADFIYMQQAYIERLQAQLISAVTVELREDLSSNVTAGVSGIQGAQKTLPAFWSGGTYVQAQQGTAKAIIRHDGSSKFTDTEITGTINATEGTLGNLTMQSGGAIYLPPTYSSQKGRLDNNGLALIYAGNDSQKIEWYSGLGTVAGQITTTSGGQLQLLSSFGVRIGTDFIGDAISIARASGSFYHEIDLNSSELKNIRKLSTVGQINMAYTSHALSANTKYHIATDTALIIITSAGSGAGIYRITGTGNSNPSNGDVKILTNAASGATTVVLMATKPPTATYESNIKVPVSYENSSFNLHENTSITLVYYGGYWRVQTDRGQ